MKPRRFWVIAVAAVVLSACATPGSKRTTPSSERVDLTVAYRRPNAGMGGAPVPGIIQLPPGKGPGFVALSAISSVLVPYRAQIVSPDLVTLGDNDNDVVWSTDVGYIPPELLLRYNASNPPRVLQDAVFGIAFSGHVRFADNKMKYGISAKLNQRGGGQAWTSVPDQDFDGAFFVRDMVGRLNEALGHAAP